MDSPEVCIENVENDDEEPYLVEEEMLHLQHQQHQQVEVEQPHAQHQVYYIIQNHDGGGADLSLESAENYQIIHVYHDEGGVDHVPVSDFQIHHMEDSGEAENVEQRPDPDYDSTEVPEEKQPEDHTQQQAGVPMADLEVAEPVECPVPCPEQVEKSENLDHQSKKDQSSPEVPVEINSPENFDNQNMKDHLHSNILEETNSSENIDQVSTGQLLNPSVEEANSLEHDGQHSSPNIPEGMNTSKDMDHDREKDPLSPSVSEESISSENDGEGQINSVDVDEENMDTDETSLATGLYRCVVCKVKFTDQGDLVRHIRSHIIHKRHKCIICSQAFTDVEHLNEHMDTHTTEGILCDICEELFPNKHKLQLHNRSEHRNDTFTCDICEHVFGSKGALVKHMKTHDKVHQCTTCGKIFTTNYRLKKHEAIHLRPTFKCEYCPKTCTSQYFLDKHTRAHNLTYELLFNCKFCGKLFSNKDMYNEHCMENHASEAVFKCEHCSELFPTLDDYENHQSKHQEKMTDAENKAVNNEEIPQPCIKIDTGSKKYRILVDCAENGEMLPYGYVVDENAPNEVNQKHKNCTDATDANDNMTDANGDSEMIDEDLHGQSNHMDDDHDDEMMDDESNVDNIDACKDNPVDKVKDSPVQYSLRSRRKHSNESAGENNEYERIKNSRFPIIILKRCDQVVEKNEKKSFRKGIPQNESLSSTRSTNYTKIKKDQSNEQSASYTCLVCKVSLNSENQLVKHIKTHIVKKPSKSDDCGTAFDSRDVLKEHRCMNDTVLDDGEDSVKNGNEIQDESHVANDDDFSDVSDEELGISEDDLESEDISGSDDDVDGFDDDDDDRDGDEQEDDGDEDDVDFDEKISESNNEQVEERTTGQKKICRCFVCKEKFEKEELLIKHIRTHIVDKPFKCDRCGKSFTDETSCGEHKCDLTFASKYRFKCNICKERFANRAEHYKHRKLHISQRYECEICHRKFSFANALKKHLMTHNKVKPLACGFCYKSFDLVKALRSHLKRAHGDQNPFKCNSCPERFASAKDCKEHSLTHWKGPHSCNECDKSFFIEKNLEKHKENCHQVKEKIKCEYCPEVFSEKSSLHKHLKKAHPKVKPFKCSKSFCLEDELQKHKKTHDKQNVPSRPKSLRKASVKKR